MRFWKIFWSKIPRSFRHILFLANDSDSTSATWTCRFNNIHVFIVIHFSFITKALVVFWKEVSWRTNLKVFSMPSSLSLNIAPKISFMTDIPSSSEVIDFLEWIHILQFAWSNKPCPQTVPRCTITKSEPRKLECIHNTVVCVRRVVYPKCQSWIRFQIFLSEFLYPILAKRSLNFKEWRVIEKDRWKPAKKWTIIQSDYVVWRSSQKCFF